MRKLSNFFDVSQLEVAPDAADSRRPKAPLTREQIAAFKERKQERKKQRLLARCAPPPSPRLSYPAR
jgi:hypothetical protein